MNYNINFQIAALIIVILLLYHFLTQKKLYNINARTFTYVLVLGGLYILLDLLSTLVFMITAQNMKRQFCWSLQSHIYLTLCCHISCTAVSASYQEKSKGKSVEPQLCVLRSQW